MRPLFLRFFFVGNSDLDVPLAKANIPEKGGIGEYRTFVHIDVRKEKSRWKG